MCCSVILLLVNEMQMSCFSAIPHLRLTMDNEQGIAHFVMFHLKYLFPLFQWHACKLALSKLSV